MVTIREHKNTGLKRIDLEDLIRLKDFKKYFRRIKERRLFS